MNDVLLFAAKKLIAGYTYGKPAIIGILFVEIALAFSCLITSEDFQGKGYRTDMMVFLIEIAKDYDCHSITLSASSDSVYRTYELLGFPKVG